MDLGITLLMGPGTLPTQYGSIFKPESEVACVPMWYKSHLMITFRFFYRKELLFTLASEVLIGTLRKISCSYVYD